MAMIRKNNPTTVFPDEIHIPKSTEYPKRDAKDAKPKSIFHIAPKHKARVQAERVGRYVYEHVFA